MLGKRARAATGTALAFALSLGWIGAVWAEQAAPAGPSPEAALAARATAFRFASGVGLDHAATAVSPAEAGALAPFAGVQGDFARLMVADAVVQANQYVAVTGDAGVVGWWNPFDDAWIVTLWAETPQGWSLQRMGALIGDDLEPNVPPADQSVALNWSNASGGLAQALWARNQERVAAFKAAVQSGRLPPVLGDAARLSRAWSAIADRQSQQLGGLLQAKERPGYGAYDRVVWRALATQARSIAFDAGMKQRLDALPVAARRSLHPVMIARRADGYTLIEQSPLAPGFLVVARLHDGVDGAPPVVIGVGAISLFGPGPAS
jgi:hypothetical protein